MLFRRSTGSTTLAVAVLASSLLSLAGCCEDGTCIKRPPCGPCEDPCNPCTWAAKEKKDGKKEETKVEKKP